MDHMRIRGMHQINSNKQTVQTTCGQSKHLSLIGGYMYICYSKYIRDGIVFLCGILKRTKFKSTRFGWKVYMAIINSRHLRFINSFWCWSIDQRQKYDNKNRMKYDTIDHSCNDLVIFDSSPKTILSYLVLWGGRTLCSPWLRTWTLWDILRQLLCPVQ